MTRGQATVDWNDDRVATVRREWAQGSSAAQIARLLGSDITRNAVIGKARRLKLGAHAVLSIPRGPAKAQPPSAPSVKSIRATPMKHPNGMATGLINRVQRPPVYAVLPTQASAWVPLQGTTPVSIFKLSSKTCRWPIEQAGMETQYCGCLPREGSRYCRAHARMSAPLRVAA